MRKKPSFYEEIKPTIYKMFEEGKGPKEIGRILEVDRDMVSKYLKKAGYTFSAYNKGKVNSNIFSTIDTEEKAYWLGFMYADGYVGKKHQIELSLAIKDEEHVKSFKEFVEYERDIHYNKSSNSCRIAFSDPIMHEDLTKLGCFNRKSLILKFPTEEQVSKNFISHFMRGYFDGDGSINKNGGPIGLDLLGTREFLTRYAETLGIDSNVLKKDKRHLNNTYHIQLTGQKARKLCDFIYKDATIYLERKYARYIEHLKRFNGFKRKQTKRIREYCPY